MRKTLLYVLNLWERKRERKKRINDFLENHGLHFIERKETSIILGCFTGRQGKKTGTKDLLDSNGNVLDENLTEAQWTKKIDEYEKAAKKEGISTEEYIKQKVKKKKLAKKENRMQEMKDNFIDINGSQTYGDHEIESFADLEIDYDVELRASRSGEAGDVISKSLKFKNKSLDPLGLAKGKALESWSKDFNKLWEEKRQFAKSIDKHFKKIHSPRPGTPSLDKVVIDFRYIDELDKLGNFNMRKKVIDYIYIGLEVNGIKFPKEYKQYLNDDNFIKLNF